METANFMITPAKPLYDLSMLREMDDNEYLLEMLDTVLNEIPADIKKMESALRDGRIDIVCAQAHKLKSSAGIIEAHTLVGLLEDIETTGKNNQAGAVLSQLIAAAAKEYQKIEKALIKEIEQIK